MQESITPTIVPPVASCGKPIGSTSRGNLRCGGVVPHMPDYVPRCEACRVASLSLGDRMAGSLEVLAHYGDVVWTDLLAFNLCVGALLWAAACNAVHDYSRPVFVVRVDEDQVRAAVDRMLASPSTSRAILIEVEPAAFTSTADLCECGDYTEHAGPCVDATGFIE